LHPFRIEANLCAFLRTLSDTDGDESLTGFNGLAITSGPAIGKEEDRTDFPATFHVIASTVKDLVVRPDAPVSTAPPLPAHRPCSSHPTSLVEVSWLSFHETSPPGIGPQRIIMHAYGRSGRSVADARSSLRLRRSAARLLRRHLRSAALSSAALTSATRTIRTTV
jgi:hypothetical protein